METKLLQEVIAEQYSGWVKYAGKILNGLGIQGETEEIMQEIILGILTKNATAGNDLPDDKELMTHYLVKVIQFTIFALKKKKEKDELKKQEYAYYLNSFSPSEDPWKNDSNEELLNLIWAAFERLDLPADKGHIFCSYFKEGLPQKDCDLRYNSSAVSKICKKIIRQIRAELTTMNYKCVEDSPGRQKISKTRQIHRHRWNKQQKTQEDE